MKRVAWLERELATKECEMAELGRRAEVAEEALATLARCASLDEATGIEEWEPEDWRSWDDSSGWRFAMVYALAEYDALIASHRAGEISIEKFAELLGVDPVTADEWAHEGEEVSP